MKKKKKMMVMRDDDDDDDGDDDDDDDDGDGDGDDDDELAYLSSKILNEVDNAVSIYISDMMRKYETIKKYHQHNYQHIQVSQSVSG